MHALFDPVWSLSLAALVCLVAAVKDLATGCIPNWLTLGALLAGLLLIPSARWVAGQGDLRDFGLALLGAALAGLVPLALFRLGAMGGGDVKLLAAVGGLLGPRLGIEVELYAFIVAALWGPAVLAYRGKLGAMFGNLYCLTRNLLVSKAKRVRLDEHAMAELKFGPAIFLGVLCAGGLEVIA